MGCHPELSEGPVHLTFVGTENAEVLRGLKATQDDNGVDLTETDS